MQDIGKLNFDNSRFFINEPNDIYWYCERFFLYNVFNTLIKVEMT